MAIDSSECGMRAHDGRRLLDPLISCRSYASTHSPSDWNAIRRTDSHVTNYYDYHSETINASFLQNQKKRIKAGRRASDAGANCELNRTHISPFVHTFSPLLAFVLRLSSDHPTSASLPKQSPSSFPVAFDQLCRRMQTLSPRLERANPFQRTEAQAMGAGERRLGRLSVLLTLCRRKVLE